MNNRRQFLAASFGAALSALGPAKGGATEPAWALDNNQWGMLPETRRIVFYPNLARDDFVVVSNLPEDHGLDFSWVERGAANWPEDFDAFKSHIRAYWKHRTPEMARFFKSYEDMEASFA